MSKFDTFVAIAMSWDTTSICTLSRRSPGRFLDCIGKSTHFNTPSSFWHQTGTIWVDILYISSRWHVKIDLDSPTTKDNCQLDWFAWPSTHHQLDHNKQHRSDLTDQPRSTTFEVLNLLTAIDVDQLFKMATIAHNTAPKLTWFHLFREIKQMIIGFAVSQDTNGMALNDDEKFTLLKALLIATVVVVEDIENFSQGITLRFVDHYTLRTFLRVEEFKVRQCISSIDLRRGGKYRNNFYSINQTLSLRLLILKKCICVWMTGVPVSSLRKTSMKVLRKKSERTQE